MIVLTWGLQYRGDLKQDLQLILSLLATKSYWFLKDCHFQLKSVQKCSKVYQIHSKMPRFSPKISKTPQNWWSYLQNPTHGKRTGYILKFLLLLSKPTGHEGPRCRNNLQPRFSSLQGLLPSPHPSSWQDMPGIGYIWSSSHDHILESLSQEMMINMCTEYKK